MMGLVSDDRQVLDCHRLGWVGFQFVLLVFIWVKWSRISDRLASDYFQVSGRTNRGKVMLRPDWFVSDHFRPLPQVQVSLSSGCLKFESFSGFQSCFGSDWVSTLFRVRFCYL